MEDAEDSLFAAESKYAVLTALVTFLKEPEWIRSVETVMERALERLPKSEEVTVGGHGELAHELFDSFGMYQDLVEQRISEFLKDQRESGLTKEDLFEQLAAASQSNDRYSAVELDSFVTRCTSFEEFLMAVRTYERAKRLACEVAADMGL